MMSEYMYYELSGTARCMSLLTLIVNKQYNNSQGTNLEFVDVLFLQKLLYASDSLSKHSIRSK